MGRRDRVTSEPDRLQRAGSRLSYLPVWAVVLSLGYGAGITSAHASHPRQGVDWAMIFPSADTIDASIPTPESVLGHPIGERAVGYEPMVRYLSALAESSPRATLTAYGTSHEGRSLYHLTITSKASHARLAEIKADNAKLADPRTLADADEAERIIRTLPGIAWMAYSIHGDELSSTDAALLLAYRLIAGTDDHAQRLRDELVIQIDPLMNPDGRERYLGQLSHLTGNVPNPDYQAMQHQGLWSAGRGNHYLFDLNRDWLIQGQPETRGRASAILEWNPHLLVDSHEMGPLDTYLFDPPREPLNISLSQRGTTWRRRFSTDQAREFDRHGWSYYTQEWYEEWYPGYTNAWANLVGAVGLLYEQASVNAASVKQRTGQTLTYPEAVHHHFVSSMANLQTLRANRTALLRDYLEDRRWAVSSNGPETKAFLVAPTTDRSRFNNLLIALRRQGIEVLTARKSFEARGLTDIWGETFEARTLPPGTLIVKSSQPRRRLLHAILDFDPHMTNTFLIAERKDLENRRPSGIYDVTAWNLPMAYALETYWAERISETDAVPATPLPSDTAVTPGKRSLYGYLIDGADSDVYRAIARLLDRKCSVRVAREPFVMSGRNFVAGTVLLRNHENPEQIPELLRESTSGLTVSVVPADTALSDKGPDLGGRRFGLLVQPRIAIASQWPIATTSFGAAWHLLDVQTELRSSPINVQSLRSMDLRKYNVIVLPHSWNIESLSSVLTETVRKKLKTWVEGGGTLIAIGRSAALLAREKSGLVSVRLRRDVLDKLTPYDEAVQREEDARRIRIMPGAGWGTGSVKRAARPRATRAEPAPIGAVAAAKPDLEMLKRDDAWHRLFSPKGVILAATLLPEHWLCFGAGDRLPVLVSDEYAFMSRHPTETPARLADEKSLRLSGLLWPEARQRWARTAYATVEHVGYGQIILFATDPFFRGYFEGSGRLFLNALLLGPGLGASQPAPW